MSNSGRALLPVLPPARIVLLPDGVRPARRVVAIALALSVAAVAVTYFESSLLASSTFLLSFAAVVIAGWYGGALGGIVATIATALLADVFLLHPTFGLAVPGPESRARFAVFMTLALVTTGFNWSLHSVARRLRESENLSRLVIESAPVLVAAADSEGRICMFNRECEQVTGLRASDVMGRPLVDTLVPGAWRSHVSEMLTNVSDVDLAAPHRNPWATLDGRERLIEWRCYRLARPEGMVTIGLGYDVTERQRIEQELHQAVERAERSRRDADAAVAARERFIATLSHELRTPVGATIGWSQLLARKGEGEESKRIAERITRSGRLVQRLLDDVRDLSRIDAGKLGLVQGRVLLNDVVASAVDATSATAIAMNVVITADLPGELPVWGDGDRLQQMMTNLLTNALKFSQDGDRVAIMAYPNDGTVNLTVEDNGPGIADEELEKVFEPFWQADARGEGLGLGLALVRQIAVLHGGTARLRRARPEGGTVAEVTIPLLLDVAASAS